MNKKTSRSIGAVLLAAAVIFVFFALGHPEMSFPWSNTITYLLYSAYLIITGIFLIAPFGKKTA